MYQGFQVILLLGLLGHSGTAISEVFRLLDTDDSLTLMISESNVLTEELPYSLGKQRNLKSIKATATSYVGAIVDSEILLENDLIVREAVKIKSSAIVKVMDVEHIEIDNGDNTSSILTTAIVEIPKSSIEPNFNRLQDIAKLEKKIDLLSKINNELIQYLGEKLNSKIIDKTTEFTEEIRLNDWEHSDKLEKLKVEKEVFEPVLNNYRTKIDKIRVIAGKNKSVELDIYLSWNIYRESIELFLNNEYKHAIRYSPISNTIKLEVPRNDNVLENHLFSQQLLIAVRLEQSQSAQEMVIYLPVGMRTPCSLSSSCYSLQFSNDTQHNHTINPKYPNPIRITGLTEAKLKSITSISASLVVMPESESHLRHW